MFLSWHAILSRSRLNPLELGSGVLLLNTWHDWFRIPRIRAWVFIKEWKPEALVMILCQ